MKSKITWMALLIGSGFSLASLPAAAYVWDAGGCASSTQTSCSDTATTSPTGGPTVTYTPISDTAGTASGNSANWQLASAYVVSYGGNLGITSAKGNNNQSGGTGSNETSVAPDHAMDNNGNSEFMLLSFGSGATKVTLNSVQLGYSNTDSDITVLAWTGASAPTLFGNTYGSLIGLGWQLIGNYANVCTTGSQTNCGTATSVAVNAAKAGFNPVSSSYWLIGAYNSVFGSNASDPNSAPSLGVGAGYYDYVKLLSVSGTVPTFIPPGSKVPEPSSLLLVGLALFGLMQLRRRAII